MRHGRKINTLSRTASHRKALMSNMAVSLLRHKRIHTTVAKAKALRKYVEPLITRSKKDTMHSRRVVFSYLRDKAIIGELYEQIAEKIGQRPGGYTRIVRLGYRKGDSAEICMIELVDFNPWTTTEERETTSKRRRSRRGSGGSKTDEVSSIEKTNTSVPQSTEEEKAEPKENTETINPIKHSKTTTNSSEDLLKESKDKATEDVGKEETAKDKTIGQSKENELKMTDSSTSEKKLPNLDTTSETKATDSHSSSKKST